MMRFSVSQIQIPMSIRTTWESLLTSFKPPHKERRHTMTGWEGSCFHSSIRSPSAPPADPDPLQSVQRDFVLLQVQDLEGTKDRTCDLQRPKKYLMELGLRQRWIFRSSGSSWCFFELSVFSLDLSKNHLRTSDLLMLDLKFKTFTKDLNLYLSSESRAVWPETLLLSDQHLVRIRYHNNSLRRSFVQQKQQNTDVGLIFTLLLNVWSVNKYLKCCDTQETVRREPKQHKYTWRRNRTTPNTLHSEHFSRGCTQTSLHTYDGWVSGAAGRDQLTSTENRNPYCWFSSYNHHISIANCCIE